MKHGLNPLPHGLEVAEAVADRSLQVGERVEQSVVGRPSPEEFPEAFDRVQLGTVTGQSLELQVRVVAKRLVDRLAPVPRGW